MKTTTDLIGQQSKYAASAQTAWLSETTAQKPASSLHKTLLQHIAILSIPLFGVLSLPTTARAQSEPAAVNLLPSPVQDYAQTLYKHGVYFNIGYQGAYANSFTGGAHTGDAYASYLHIGATLDMAKLANIPGGTVHIMLTERAGQNLSTNSINTDAFVQAIYGGNETYQLSTLVYEQKLLHNFLDISIGRMDISNTFNRAALGCYFMSIMACGNEQGETKIITKSAYPFAVWGGTLQINPTKHTYTKIGVFQSDPTVQNTITHGFDWSTRGSNGFVVPIEAGYQWRTPGANEENHYALGVILDHVTYSEKTPFKQTFDNPSTIHARTALYAMASQMVWQAAPKSERGIYLFGNVMLGASGSEQTINWDADGGIVWQGPFASRPDDYFSAGANILHYNNAFLRALYKSRVAEHGTQYPDSTQTQIEMDYSIQATKWLSIMPNIQAVVNPNGLAFKTYPKANLPTAWVAGLEFTIDINKLLGIPLKE